MPFCHTHPSAIPARLSVSSGTSQPLGSQTRRGPKRLDIPDPANPYNPRICMETPQIQPTFNSLPRPDNVFGQSPTIPDK